MYTGSGDVKQKRRARRPEGEEWSEAGIRNLRQQVKYALRFFVVETALHQNPKQLSLSPPSRTAASASSQAGQSNNTKKQSTTRRAARKPLKRLAIADASRRAHGSNHSAISGTSVTSRIIVSIMSCLEFAASSIRIASAKGLA